MTRDEILAFLSKQRESWQRRDPEALALTQSWTGWSIVRSSRRSRGGTRFRTSGTSRSSVPSRTGRSTDREPFIDGDRVAVPFTAHATHAGRFMGLDATGRRFEIQGVLLMELRDGLIANERRIHDFTGLLIQCGVLRGKPGV